MEDKRKSNGGARKGAGRPKKVDEMKANEIFVNALKQVYNKDESEEAKIEFVKSLLDSQRGQIFVAEHVFGKAKDIVENVNKNFNADVTAEEVATIKKVLYKDY